MEKLTAASPQAQSTDLVAGNIEQLKALFPELLTEGKDGVAVNVDVLKALVGDASVTDADEKYGLNWHGKRRARQLALTPSTGTLRPCPEDSVDWETTQNLMIEGDNLEVLKLLQKSYAGKVKLIYIDPPYNTGKDFVYPDNFQDNIRNYLELTGQVEGGQKISSNTEASGRFHTDWLNMMYPRLRLAKNLLSDNGLVFISIDSSEATNLRSIMDEVFGSENFIGLLPTVMNLKGNNDAFAFADTHEFTVVYARNRENCVVFQLPVPEDSLDDWLEDERGLYKRADTLRRTGQDASRERRPNGWFPVFIDENGTVYTTNDDKPRAESDITLWPVSEAGEELSWTWSKQKINDEPFNLIVVDGKSGKNIYKKQRASLGDLPTSKPKSILYKPEYSSSNGTAEIASLLGSNVFDSPPKPRSLIRDFVIIGTSKDDIVLDFFAGTGTTGHAVMAQNLSDHGSRRFILVQLPQSLDPMNKGQKTAAEFCDKIGKPRTIAELTKERLRRAAAKIKADSSMFTGDTGFRVFKLDHSNIRAWNPNPADLEASLFDHQDHLLEGRSEADVLYELLLKLGLDLCVPIEKRSIEGLDVHAVGGGVLLACLAETITREQVEPLAQGIVAWHKELAPAGDTTCVFRDSAFQTVAGAADDVAKTNLAAILEQHGIQNVRSL
ncbi:site-specific DNA-methyltransferase [Achromobacter xylosoxidans]|uniref:site-specific DNA-methyltransferase (adenine-specific) n=2 Tax=Comamonas TaxID=283 RepID=A0AA42Q4R5_9BURK|nr:MULTISPECIES: site-specific DNA-methyltransferase [Burkholderiales]MCR4145866.1 site-specific DNA-methyltransferase [Alcaligenes faecalis]MDH0362615.1 site-specific DNA-methyltransferase [Comamonas aquatica]MDH0382251.1 site-specific DNA-methyltransferase [Comamonas aquatica]MDH0428797.1 site-specific DNA-methyltransferase [Comamonas aquatica]MDH0939465.1 site-specific DNA-methyltransferase [Comamonas aquatica]